ncbi:ankyrin repeat domain-containing protein [Nostoc sp. TCL26-01]|uniref:ankyrin repeat domain-containing protein n=1 Tax=Nostoc sp. TCL26-01 TaxID=2576904 RepID=UPI0021177737|nr:ankyrin repeat domain-containing protein [Nostoc sp. TCL26-01]
MQIHLYAERGDIAGVAQEITQGVDIDCLDEYSYPAKTPLMYAVTSIYADINMMRFLVENGANVNAVNNELRINVLSLAVQSENQNVDKIKFLLDTGADINYRTSDGNDVLIDALYGIDIFPKKDLLAILKLLISQGAAVNTINHYGASALKIAGGLGRFDAMKLLLDSGCELPQLEWTELTHTIVFGTIEELKILLNTVADKNVCDAWGRTPLVISLQVGDIEKAKLLLAAGANCYECEDCQKTPLMYAIENNHLEVFQWLITEGFDIEATDEYDHTALMLASARGATDFVRILLAVGAEPDRGDNCRRTAIAKASNLEIVQMLVDAGEDLSDINHDMWRSLTGVSYKQFYLSQITPEQYSVGKHRYFGKTNPEIMEIDFWKAMICSHDSAYTAKSIFGDTENENWNQLVWCYQRFAKTTTQLPDGRVIDIGGSHEDYYDPDFCIYNDVVVYRGDGNFQIWGYPRDIFPPTDFHSATLVGEHIYIIGNLGYDNERIFGETPVYRLHYDTGKIDKIITTGEKPGWISHHQAFYQEPNKIYLTGGKLWVMDHQKPEYPDNHVDYILDLTNFIWSSIKV